MFLCYKQYFWFTVDINKNHFAKILLFLNIPNLFQLYALNIHSFTLFLHHTREGFSYIVLINLIYISYNVIRTI